MRTPSTGRDRGATGSRPADCAESTAPSGESVTLAGNSAVRWWSGSMPWSSADVSVSGVFTPGGATTGNRGYGILARGTGATSMGVQSGYTFQVDPGAGGGRRPADDVATPPGGPSGTQYGVRAWTQSTVAASGVTVA